MPHLRLFGPAREAAGSPGAEVPGSTPEEVLAAAVERFGPAFAQVLETSALWVNGEPALPSQPLGASDELAVLPPVSGGCADEAPARPALGSRLEAKILTVSSAGSEGRRADTAGPALAEALERAGFRVLERRVVGDGVEPVSSALREMASGFAGLVVSTGGTGFGPLDLTPEATRRVLEREAPGLAEAARAASPLGRLSRGLAGTVGACLVLNLPGSARGAVESLEAVLDVLPHALALLAGEQPH
ncbi:MAG TPA: molybdenum cofactor synthesis domain-containing protein [Acidimicrobiales bacterium]|nr:molybdenum cofactor synthesis domain-containing protein [Acidimicrobiales bacterium]